MATVVKATEHVLVETATAVAATVTKAATSEFKSLESGIAQEAVSASDDNVSNLLDKVEGAVEVVIEEVVKGAGEVVETVKQHPELIAEGALAVAVGVASLVQPELIAGEVAILGKMAADSAKKTVTKIASDEGEKIVKAISKDLADDAKVEAEKDKVQAEEKAQKDGTDGAEKDGESETATKDSEPAKAENDKSGEKTIAIELQKEAAVKAEDGSKEVESAKESTPVELKITIGADGEIKAVSKSVSEAPKTEEKTEEEKPVEKSDISAVPGTKTEAAVPVKEESSAPVTPKAPLPVVESKSVASKDTPKPVVQDATVEPVPEDAGSEPKESTATTVKEIPIPIIQERSIPASAIVAKVEIPISKEAVEKSEIKQEGKKEIAKDESKSELSPALAEAVASKEVSIPEPNTVPVEKTVDGSTPVEAVQRENSDTVKEELVEEPKSASLLQIPSTVEPATAEAVSEESKKQILVPESDSKDKTISNSPEILDPELKESPKPSVSAPAPVENTIVDQVEEVSNAPSPSLEAPIEAPIEQPTSPEIIEQHGGDELVQTPVIEGAIIPAQLEESTPAKQEAVKKDLATVIEGPVISETLSAKSGDDVSVKSAPKSLAVSIKSEPVLETSPPLDNVPSTAEFKDTPQDEPIPTQSTSKPLEAAIFQAKEIAVSALDRPTSSENDSIQVAVASVTNTIKTTSTTTTVEQPSSPVVPMVTVTQESLDHLHSKLDAMHEAIQLITKTLAAHLPPASTEAPKQANIEAIPTVVSEPIAEASVPEEPETSAEQTQSIAENEIIPVPTESQSSEQPQASPEVQPTEAPTSTPKRPTHVKRKSVILTIGSYLWPFGGSTSKAEDLKVNTVEISPDEIEVDGAKKDTAPGPELRKAASTVSVSDVAAPAVAAG